MWCTKVLWAYGMQAEYICLYAPLIILVSDISVDSAPAMQAL